jgi:hypothetical protein
MIDIKQGGMEQVKVKERKDLAPRAGVLQGERGGG